ncbi:hypothetical protein AA105894_2397 [Asaia spathodeae NBRC 105894]|nr:hypothetical protein AA105894_2397 [Asaia spathodeae NBRC 105894]
MASFKIDLAILLPVACLFLDTQSFRLSKWVPSDKWSGFTQSRLSHRCRTISPSSVGPQNKRYETT